MELVASGDFRSMDPIFKGCYGDLFLYTDMDLGQLRWCGIHLPPFRSEIPAPLTPFYLQAKQPKATKWSPPRATAPNPAVESPKAKCSGCKVGITVAWDAAPTHQLQSAWTLLQPRSLPVPSSQPQMNRTSLPRVVALASMANPPHHPPSQLDTNGRHPHTQLHTSHQLQHI